MERIGLRYKVRIFVNQKIKKFFVMLTAVLCAFFFSIQYITWKIYGTISGIILVLFLLTIISVLLICFWYVYSQNRMIETAITKMNAYLDGDTEVRIDCDEEGSIYQLFHSINTLAAVLNAHSSNEYREKEFLKNTISDISHQLKTPLTALNIYNGLMQEETEENPEMREFVALSEQELDRMETLVHNLLKITKLDAGSVIFEKKIENVNEMMKDIELYFTYRAKQEGKELIMSGEDEVTLLCDRDWLIEAVSNIVKNAFDHTQKGSTIWMEWKQRSSLVQIVIKDNGSGIHPEDLYHIFKRFYRSRYSKDTQGIGLGLSLTKSIVEAHNGTIEVNSELGAGTTFVINFLIPTKL